MVVQGLVLRAHPRIQRSSTVLVVDLYDPFHLEHLELRVGEPSQPGLREASFILTAVNEQLSRGDFFLCASEKQRDLWLGHLAALGRINPLTYAVDPTLRGLVDVVPFGLPARLPEAGASPLRGAIPGIATGDLVILWGGGLYPWFDPLLLVRAVARLAPDLPVRLVFPGGAHPNPNAPPMTTSEEVRVLANELGLVGRNVFFLDRWVPYELRDGLFLDADIGVTTHRDHLETRFAFRTRMLDYIWTRLPVVTTAGDTMAELVSSRGLGMVVQPGDEQALADSMAVALTDASWRQRVQRNMEELRPALTWMAVAQPLLRFLERPEPAPDLRRITDHTRPRLAAGAPGAAAIFKHDVDAAKRTIHGAGWRGLWATIRRRTLLPGLRSKT